MATNISNINLYLTIDDDGTGSVSATEPGPQYTLTSTVYITSDTTSVNNFGIIIYHKNNNTWEPIAQFMAPNNKQPIINIGTPITWTLTGESTITTTHVINNASGLNYRIAIVYKYGTETNYRSCYMPVSGRKLMDWNTYNESGLDIGVIGSESNVVIETGNEGGANL